MGLTRITDVAMTPGMKSVLTKFLWAVGDDAPVDGATGAGMAKRGAVYINATTGLMYNNTGTRVSPVWTVANAGGLVANILAATATGRGYMADGYFSEAQATAKFAAGAIATGLLKAGLLSADAAGRGKFAANFFDATTVDAKFATGSIGEDRLTGNELTGRVVGNVADDAVIGGVPVVHMVAVASGANGDVDVTLTHKTRVLDVLVILKGAGTAGSTVTVKNAANAITNAIDVSGGGDKAVFRGGEIDDARYEIAAAGTLKVSKASTGGDFPGALVVVTGVRVAT